MNPQGENGISYTRWTSNPVYVTRKDTGKRGHHCVRVRSGVDPSGCDFCYAALLNVERFGTGLDFTAENGDLVEWHLSEKELRAWQKAKPARIFPFDMTDIFQAGIPRGFLVRCFAAILLARHMTFQVLTKRAGVQRQLMNSEDFQAAVVLQARAYAAEWGVPYPYDGDEDPFPLHNLWNGVTVATDKDRAVRVNHLRRTKSAVRWISLEPQLEVVSFSSLYREDYYLRGEPEGYRPFIDWIVQGGESGSVRPFREEWARAMRDECAEWGVAYFLKQMGEDWSRRNGCFPTDTHGKRLENLPPDLRVRQFPALQVEFALPLRLASPSMFVAEGSQR